MAAAGALQAYSEYQSSRADAAASSTNARLADAAAGDARLRAATEAGEARMAGSQVAGSQRAALGANGVDLSTTTARSLFDTTRARAELDAKTAVVSGAREAWGFESEAAQHRAAAKASRRRSVLGPLGTIVGTAGSMYGSYKSWNAPKGKG